MRMMLTVFSAAACFCLAAAGCNPRVAAISAPARVERAPTEAPVIPLPQADAVCVPPGYRAEVVVTDLIYPTSVEFDGSGNMYIAESGYVYGDQSAPARVTMVGADGMMRVVADNLTGPVTDLLWYDAKLYIAQRGKISTLSDEQLCDILTGLPSLGDHHNNQMAAGPDGKIYFGQGTATNSGVVGVDNFLYMWLPLYPDFHDQPARDIRLTGRSFTTMNPFIMAGGKGSPTARTGAFQPFGSAAGGTTVRGAAKANGTIMRVNPDGSELEVYAWGLRNPFGVTWGPDGQLYATENGFDERGSRPIANDADDLYRIRQGAWYGWPDFASGIPVTDPRFKPADGPRPRFLMADHPPVEKPVMSFPPHSAVAKIAFDPTGRFAGPGCAFVALFGQMTPVTGREETATQAAPVGQEVVRVDLSTGQVQPFFVNLDRAAQADPASPGLRRPVDVIFSPDGAMYVADLGSMEALKTRVPLPKPFAGTGTIWRIVPDGVQVTGPPAGLSVLPGANDMAVARR